MRITVIFLFLLAVLGKSALAQTILFEDQFESTTFKSAWTPRPNLSGVNGVVDISTTNPKSGQYAVRMGKSQDAGGFTNNSLDLQLNLAGQTQVEMTFNIYDNDDDDNFNDGIFPDGIYFSNNGGTTFRKVLDFQPATWCNQYGQMPPLDIVKLAEKVGLTLTSNFIVRFWQHDDGDFSNNGTGADGFYIDDVKVYVPNLTYSNLPFFDNFEANTLKNSWAWRFAEQTTGAATNVTRPSNLVEIDNGNGFNSLQALRMGKRCDDGIVTNAFDLHLNLAGQTQVEMTFRIYDQSEEDHPQDGLYFSNDGGLTFKKAFDFLPESWCNQYGAFPPLDIDALAAKINLTFTNKFIIRFQQHDDGDFSNNGTGADGIYLDDVSVYVPQLRYATLPFEDNFEGTDFDAVWAWRFADKTAGTGAVDFTRPSNLVEVYNGNGYQSSRAARLGKRCDDGEVTNALDLHLNLAGQTQVEMTFFIYDNDDETQAQDGIYFSNDGGLTFKKVLDFQASLWCNQYGAFPPLDIDELAAKVGLALTDKFVVRFQQHDDGDFSNNGTGADGIYLDNVRVYAPRITYANLPFTDGFESGLGESWKWRFAEATALPAQNITKPSGIVEVIFGNGFNSSGAVRMGKRCDEGLGNFNTNALDLHANLLNKRGVVLTFKIYDNGDQTHVQDGIYFSSNGGATFVKVIDFVYGNLPDNAYADFRVNVDSLITRFNLSWSSSFIIRFQQHDIGDFSNNGISACGFYLDNIDLRASSTGIQDAVLNNALRLAPNPATHQLLVELQNTEGGIFRLQIADILGRTRTTQTVNAPQTTFSIADLPNGLYWLTITTTDGRQAVQKFVKQ